MKKLIAVIMFFLCVCGGIGYYMHQKLSYQPGWYETDETDPARLLNKDPGPLIKTISNHLKQGKPFELSPDQTMLIMIHQLGKHLDRKTEKAVKGIKTTVDTNHATLEMIIDVRQLSLDRLPGKIREIGTAVLKMMPEKTLSRLYVNCDLKTQPGKKALSLDPSSTFSIGKTAWPLETLVSRLDSKPDELLKKARISQVELKKNRIKLYPDKKK